VHEALAEDTIPLPLMESSLSDCTLWEIKLVRLEGRNGVEIGLIRGISKQIELLKKSPLKG
jgi:hypothetical protein